MYLSRLILDPQSAAVRRDIVNPWEMHRTLWSAFPSGLDGREDRILWRLEYARDGGAAVLVQSPLEPDWPALTTKFPGYFREPAGVKRYQPHFDEGQRLHFRLRANASVKRDGKRRSVIGEVAQVEWLARHGERGGFALERVDVRDEGTRRFRKGDQKAQLSIAYFEGVLRVLALQPFMQRISGGIGHSKGLGFGLLSVAPAG